MLICEFCNFFYAKLLSYAVVLAIDYVDYAIKGNLCRGIGMEILTILTVGAIVSNWWAWRRR